MEKYDVNFKKKYGQNFLKNNYVVDKIVGLSKFPDNSLAIEVGPGGGILTLKLSELCSYVIAYEIDFDLKETLSSKFSNSSNVTIIFKDFLEADLEKDISNFNYDHLFFISNVPYYITTPILMKLIQSNLKFDKIIMMQIDFCRYPHSVRVRKEFIPEPKVDSMIISFSLKKNKYNLIDYNHFKNLVYDSFKFKRKTLRNNLKSYDLSIISKVLMNYGFDLSIRAEKLSVEIFVNLSNSLCKREF